MLESLIHLARTMRTWLYRVSSSTFCGIDVDFPLHFIFGGLIFHFTQKHFGTRVAIWVLGTAIVAKEIIDLFLKSHLRYIHAPSFSGILDMGTDMLFGTLGGLAAWAWNRRRHQNDVSRKET